MTAIGLLRLTSLSSKAKPSLGGAQEWMAEDNPHYWSWIRQQFSIPPDEAYFNTGTLEPVLNFFQN
jgi:hypothetical protein